MMQPSLRKPVGILAMLLLITLWAIAVGSLSQTVGKWPDLAQSLFYIAAGTIWILPLRPFLRWMETGRFRNERPPRGQDPQNDKD